MKYAHHKYTFELAYGGVRHQWSLVGPRGGLHFHIYLCKQGGDNPPSAGLEVHYPRGSRPDYMAEQAPSQLKCWLLGEPCWHDGTSLYASETLWPKIKDSLERGDHLAVFALLEREADERFDTPEGVQQ